MNRMAESRQSVKSIFLAACKLEGQAREQYILDACGDDFNSLQQLRQLLSAHQCSTHPLDRGCLPKLNAANMIELGESIGAYRLIKEIGEGGFGVVYQAEQSEPFQRIVALKIVKAGMDTRAYLRRFEAERQTLAMLNHPGIAALFDGGSTDLGRPYFVMEFVQGDRITEYCKQFKLTLDQRLELFESVCAAIEHAHQRGVIHRDIKPSNILVSRQTGETLAKVIDFGIAKIISESQTNDDHTVAGDFLGTPMYTSPEQALGRSIDTRSDIYSLGMVLYELVAGRPALNPEVIRGLSQSNALRYASESSPTRPSQILKSAANSNRAAEDIDHPAEASPMELLSIKRLRSELDPIILKAISKEPGQRYASVSELVADIQRFRYHQPVQARNQSTGYVLKKLIARNKRTAAFVLSLAATVVCMLFVSLFTNVRLNSLLERAVRAEKSLSETSHEAKLQAQNALLNQARSHAHSRRAGQRFDSLDALRNSLKIEIDFKDRLDQFRTVAAAAIALPDIRPRRIFDFPGQHAETAISSRLDLLGYLDVASNRFRIIDLLSQKTIMELEAGDWHFSEYDYRGPRFSPDSQYLVYSKVVEDKPRLHLWRINSVEPMKDFGATAVSVSFRPDMKQCAVTHNDGTILILDFPSLRESGRLQVGEQKSTLDWDKSGARFSVWQKNEISVHDANSLQILCQRESKEGLFDWHDWHPDGRRIVSITDRGKVILWDAATGELLEEIVDSISYGNLVKFSNSGRYLALNNWTDHLRIIDMETGSLILQSNARGTTLEFSAEDRILTADIQATHVNIFDFHPAQEVQVVAAIQGGRFEAENRSEAFSPDGRWLALTTSTGVSLLDIHHGLIQHELPIPQNRPIGWFEDSFVTIGADGVVHWPCDSSDPTRLKIGPPEQLLSIEAIGTWSTDASGNYLVGGTSTQVGLLIDRQRKSIEVLASGDIRAGGIDRTGRWISMGTHGQPSTTTLWEASESLPKQVHKLPIGVLARFSADADWFVATGLGTQKWTMGDLQRPELISEHSQGVCLSPDSQLLGIEAAGDKVDILGMPSGKKLLTVSAPDPTRLRLLTFSRDNSRLYAVGRETSLLYIFDLPLIEKELRELGMSIQVPWPHSELPRKSGSSSDKEFELDFNIGDYPKWEQSALLARQGDRWLNAGEHEKAIELYRQSVELNPSGSQALNNLAWLLALDGTAQIEFDEALTCARQSVRSTPFLASHWNTLAYACWKAGNFAESLTAVRESIRRNLPANDPFDSLIEVVALYKTQQRDLALEKWRLIQATKISDDKQYLQLFQEAERILGTDP